MKGGLKDVVGKKIAGVVVASSERSPKQQVFLVFTDGSCFELHGNDFSCYSGLDDAAQISDYVISGRGKVTAVYGDPEAWRRRAAKVLMTGRGDAPYDVPALETLEGRMERDLRAWEEAKSLITRAKNR